MYRYTLCLLKSGQDVLLLNRKKPPAMGLWNGVGGKIELGETVEASVCREVFEADMRLNILSIKGRSSCTGNSMSGCICSSRKSLNRIRTVRSSRHAKGFWNGRRSTGCFIPTIWASSVI
ncbi:NUDIX domain-containing protein [Exiguobacterium mexicanum]|uniref:NUDIX domain-containing protein n=1 Tax=Exiguobacterium mexicanum TaxID=340146 RepID=UPI0037BF52F8